MEGTFFCCGLGIWKSKWVTEWGVGGCAKYYVDESLSFCNPNYKIRYRQHLFPMKGWEEGKGGPLIHPIFVPRCNTVEHNS